MATVVWDAGSWQLWPALRVKVVEGRTAEILRVDVLVPVHEVLGPVSYPWELFESFRFFSLPTVDGVVLLNIERMMAGSTN